jgi:hypothetical protein
MTSCASARACLSAVAAISFAGFAHAGIWYTEPVLGLAADYSTNPQLLEAAHTATGDAAILLDSPTTYSADAAKLVIDPSFRFSDNSGYASLVSDYEHLTVGGELDSERNSLKATAAAERDSSLYQDYALNGSIGVRQDTALADVTWLRSLTERLSFSLDANYSRVRYGESNGAATLTDYKYTSASPQLSWKAGEATTLTLLGGYSVYDSLDGTTQSDDANLEAGFVRQLGELWTLTVDVGSSRESNQIKEYFGPFYLGTFKATENGAVFSGNLSRQEALTNTTLTASRKLTPSGFSFLSRRDLYELLESYAYSARWTLQGYVRLRKQQDPQFFAPTVERKYFDVGASAAWLVTEHWAVTFSASHVAEKYSPPSFSVAESQISVELARHFNRIVWH